MDKFDKKTRSQIMSAIRAKNTSPEKIIFKTLRINGIYFQRHYKKILGTPDIAIPSRKLAVFIDGDFWHGFRFPIWKKRLNSKFWIDKIERNRKRDKLYHRRLRSQGWKILRIWEHQIESCFDLTIKKLFRFLKTP